MSKEKVVPIPDGPLARYLAEHQGWAATKEAHEQAEPKPLRYELASPYSHKQTQAKFCAGLGGAVLEITAYSKRARDALHGGGCGGSWVSLSLAEAERLCVWLNEVIGESPNPETQTPP